MAQRSNGEKTEKELLQEISGKLDKAIALLAMQGKSNGESLKILSGLGLTSTEIGLLLGKPPGTIRRLKSTRAKKKRKK